MLPAYWIYLFCSTHFPKPKIPGSVSVGDWVLHLCAFVVLAFLFWRFAESFNRTLSNRFVWIAFVVLGVYAALDEYLQQFVNRSTSLSDWLADLAGIAIALIPLELHRRLTQSAIRSKMGARLNRRE